MQILNLHLKYARFVTVAKPSFLFRVFLVGAALLVQGVAAQQSSPAHELVLQLDQGKSVANITLTGNFHSVEGSFLLKRGMLRYDATSGRVNGEIVFDSASGKTGNDSRDKKMHKDVLESAHFPEISFRADHADGMLAISGDSTLEVHGFFSIHGAAHEITLPVQISVRGDNWSAKSSFVIPYAKWGMKNPSVLFLRVSSEVTVEFRAAGSLTR